MQQARDVLLDDAVSVTATRPPEIGVVYYDPNQPEKGKVWGAEARELWQIDEPIAKAFRSAEARTIGVIARRRAQLVVLERHLAKRFRCARLRGSEEALDLADEWVNGYASAITVEHHTHRLLTLASAVAPRHEHLDFASRIGVDGIDPARLRQPRRALADAITGLARRCDTLQGAFRAVHDLMRLECAERGRASHRLGLPLHYAPRTPGPAASLRRRGSREGSRTSTPSSLRRISQTPARHLSALVPRGQGQGVRLRRSSLRGGGEL